MGKPVEDITGILNRASTQDQEALLELWPKVYTELRKLAAYHFKSENSGHSLQPTALVNEAFLKLREGKNIQFQNRSHFFAIASRIMRQILVDHAKAKRALKRGGGALKIAFDDNRTAEGYSEEQLLEVNEALEKLLLVDADLAKVVELRYFGGMSVEETAEALDLSQATVKRYFSQAKLWLFKELSKQKKK